MMDQKVVQFYRLITREGFKYQGKIENPSIFLDSVGEKIPVCSKVLDSFIHIYINIHDDRLDEVKYMQNTRPAANVAAEIFCSLVKGKTISEAEAVTEKSFSEALGTEDEEYLTAARGLIKLLHRGLDRYKECHNKN